MTTYTADDFEHAHFAMHPVTGSVASKGRMDWKWVLPGWYDTGDVSRLSDQRMAEAGWAPVRMPAKQCRSLTVDDIPVREFEAMADRALARWDEAKTVWAPRDAMREAVRAALTEPPRPAWADLADTLRAIDPAETLSIDDLAKAAHEHGVRVASVGLTPTNPEKEQNR